MNILFVGDVVGRPGRRILLERLRELREALKVQLVITNVENAAAGFGITEPIAADLLAGGVDVLTSGNHIWDKKEALEFIDRTPRLLRPHNYPPGTPGTGWLVTEAAGVQVGVLNVLGTVFMHPVLECPFRCADAALAAKPPEVRVVVIDFHAEATSEKTAMGWYLDGRVSAVIGSHSHVPTADERVLPRGTAFISDAGMTGCYDSVIGMDKDKAIERFLTRLPMRFEVASGPGVLCAVLVTVDERTGKSTAIRRIRIAEGEAVDMSGRFAWR